jgi:hypothetical protein
MQPDVHIHIGQNGVVSKNLVNAPVFPYATSR